MGIFIPNLSTSAEAMPLDYYSNPEEFQTEEDALGIFGPNLSTSTEAMLLDYYSNPEEFRTEEGAWGIFGPNLSNLLCNYCNRFNGQYTVCWLIY